MSIEMENPKGLVELIDAAWNHVEQIRIAMTIGDIKHANVCQNEASRLLSLAMQEAEEYTYLGGKARQCKKA